MSAPRPEVRRFIERAFPGARVEPLAGDASTRAFYRIYPTSGGSRVLMDYGRPFSEPTDDIRLNRIFREADLRVAGIVETGPEPGCLVLEDLGDRTLEAVLAGEDEMERQRLLRRAADLASDVARLGTPALTRSDRAAGPSLDGERFRFEMRFFVDHYLGSLLQAAPVPGLEDELGRLADAAADTPRRVLCHRDFHSRNLMLTDDGALAMVDIQDARWGPDTYDLASLLHDAYIDIDAAWAASIVEERADADPDPRAYRLRLDRVAAQRLIKMLGTFGYQVAVRGRSRYRSAIPRTLRRLHGCLSRRAETERLAAALVASGVIDTGS
jgi:aminoglycoside/choline kinase family phosphotransferase